MSEEPDLVRLLYRADWTRLSLAADVSASQDPSRDPAWLPGGVPPGPPPEPGDFRPDIPPGMRVAEESWDQPPSGPVNPWGLVARQAAKETRSALRNVLGALHGEDKR